MNGRMCIIKALFFGLMFVLPFSSFSASEAGEKEPQRGGVNDDYYAVGGSTTIGDDLIAAGGETKVSSGTSTGDAVDLDTSLPSYLPNRRKEQFTASPGYAIFPYPYSLPGVGEGISLIGATMNISNTYTDAYGIILAGEVEGLAVGMTDIHIIPRTLIFDIGYSDISKVQVMSYSGRGMNTEKNDFRLLDINDSVYFGGRMTATFFDRRFEMYGGWYKDATQLDSIRDKDGNIIVDAQDATREWSKTTLIGTRLDLTDDYADPRRGFRLNIARYSTPSSDSGPDYSVMDYNMTAYLPIGKRSTWAFNFLRSDADVTQKGEIDPLELQNQQGINCSDPSLTPLAQQYCTEVINNTIANNTYGTATSLGGFSYLRAYPQGSISANLLFTPIMPMYSEFS